VLAANHSESLPAAEALEKLGRPYWYPLYAYVCRSDSREETAKDLIQAFFARLLERNLCQMTEPVTHINQ
jgi:hypothetical protein